MTQDTFPCRPGEHQPMSRFRGGRPAWQLTTTPHQVDPASA
ncbi:hypothetical protein ACFFX0_02940 [Citricoccus parietis]|uniref:Uncharacterized protein n=1 Tax=Citricoccus parietis TaxID=592307 RepID=A0ABV5FU61_9MICC